MHSSKFLEKQDELSIHSKQINLYGGFPGIRDEGLLDSAISQPQATFGRELLHSQFLNKQQHTCFTLIITMPLEMEINVLLLMSW